MLLSFSIPAMRPMIENGLREIAGEPVDGRTKRQTIRRYGPAYQRLFRHGTADERWSLDDLQLDLWWKSRTPGRVKLGQTTGVASRVTVKRLNRYAFALIAADTSTFGMLARYQNMDREGSVWHADGFDSAVDFMNYFTPNEGDVFDGVLFQW
ncbi:MAG: hypothetical protein P1U84_12095 [Parvibaculaceae bacterium]|nr:hypothetical protein [Parvibaculaceae bacterium]